MGFNQEVMGGSGRVEAADVAKAHSGIRIEAGLTSAEVGNGKTR